nr:MAG: polyprotein [Jingmen bat marnavirus 2]
MIIDILEKGRPNASPVGVMKEFCSAQAEPCVAVRAVAHASSQVLNLFTSVNPSLSSSPFVPTFSTFMNDSSFVKALPNAEAASLSEQNHTLNEITIHFQTGRVNTTDVFENCTIDHQWSDGVRREVVQPDLYADCVLEFQVGTVDPAVSRAGYAHRKEADEMSAVTFAEEDFLNCNVGGVIPDVVKAPLVVHSARVVYNPSMTIDFLVKEILAGARKEDLVGFPTFWLERVAGVLAGTSKVASSPFSSRPRAVKVVQESTAKQSARWATRLENNKGPVKKKVAVIKPQPYSPDQVTELWKLTGLGRPETATRPARYSRSKFVAWMQYELYVLRKQLASPTQVVVGNEAARTLYFGAHLSSAQQQELLLKSAFYVHDYNHAGQIVRAPLLSEWVGDLGNPTLVIAGKLISSLEELLPFEYQLGSKGRLAFKLARRAFSGEAGLSFAKIQQLVDAVVLRDPLPVAAAVVQTSLDILSEVEFPRLALQAGPAELMSAAEWDAVAMELMEELSAWNTSELTAEAARIFLNVASFLYSLRSATSLKSLFSILTMFVTADRGLFQFVVKSFKEAGVKVMATAEMVFQSSSSWLADNIRFVYDVTLGVVVGILAKAFGAEFYGQVVPLLSKMSRQFTAALCKTSMDELAKTILAKLKTIFRSLVECATTGSLAPLWGPMWSPYRLVVEMQNVEMYFSLIIGNINQPSNRKQLSELVEKGELSASWVIPMTRGEALKKCDELVLQTREVLAYFQDNQRAVMALSGQLKSLERFMAVQRVTLSTAKGRRAPFVIYWTGKPGVGKSNLCTMVSLAMARKFDYPVNEGRYEFVPGLNFQTGLDGSTWWVNMDDVDQSTLPPQGRTHTEWLVALANNAPCTIEAAHVDQKGTLAAAPRLLTVCSNFSDMRASAFSAAPEAVTRRFNVRIDVRMRPEFTQPCGVKLDREKCKGFSDLYFFTIDFPGGIPPGFESYVRTDVTLPELIPMLFSLYEKWDSHQTEALLRLEGEGEYCPICFFPNELGSHCACPSTGMVLQSGPSNSWMSAAAVLSPFLLMAATRLPWRKAGRKLLALTPDSVQGPVNFFLTPDLSTAWAYRRSLAQGIVKVVPFKLLAGATGALLLAGFGLFYAVFSRTFKVKEQAGTAVEWTRVSQTYRPGVPVTGHNSTFTIADIRQAARSSVVDVQNSRNQRVYGYSLGSNTLLVPTHILDVGEKGTIKANGRSFEFVREQSNSVVLADAHQLMVCRVSELSAPPGILKKFGFHVDHQLTQYDEVFIMHPNGDRPLAFHRLGPIKGQQSISGPACTDFGDCGALYVGRINTHWKVVAMHYALVSVGGGADLSAGARTCGDSLTSAIRSLLGSAGEVSTLQSTFSPDGRPLECSYYEKYSEVHAAMTSPGADIYPIGRLKGMHAGVTQRTKMAPSMLAPHFSEFILSSTGVPGYWQLPDFRGEMVDGLNGRVWESSYTDAFKTQNVKQPINIYLMAAVLDYLSGIGKLRLDGYSVLSDEQVLSGVSGTDIKAINKLSSVGPPFNRSKTTMVYVERGKSEMHPQLVSMIDEIESCLARGDIPAPCGSLTLKDEPVKPGKLPRVFIVLPFAYNFVMRRHGAWQYFMRDNCDFFESAVGINITSNEAARLVDHLRKCDPSLENVYACDASRMDKSLSATLLDAVADVIGALALAIGVSPVEAKALIHGLKHTRYMCKGDVFSTLGWNPSGNQATVEINGIITSIGMRYAYFRRYGLPHSEEAIQKRYSQLVENPIVDCSWSRFRERFRLYHYGDDNLFTCLDPLGDEFLEVWKDELGIVMTNAAKDGRGITAQPISQVDFLKRTFTWDDELKMWLMPLSKKSLSRMLAIRKPSVLSDRDHAAAILSDVNREMFYYGRSEWTVMREKIDSVVSDLYLSDSGYLNLLSFDDMWQEASEGTFSAWRIEGPRALASLEGVLVYQSFTPINNTMTTVTEQTAPKDGAEMALGNQHIDSDLSIQEDVLTIKGAAPVVAVTPVNSGRVVAPPPDAPFSSFLNRPVLGAVFDIDSTQLPGHTTIIGPWLTWKASQAVREKLKDFYLYRGSMEMVVRVSAPAMAFGAIAVTAIPAGLQTSQESYALDCNVLQADHAAWIDVATSNTVELTLPWVFPYDYDHVVSTVDPWLVTFTVMSTVRSVVPAANPVVTLAIYFKPINLELRAPVPQDRVQLQSGVIPSGFSVLPQEAAPLVVRQRAVQNISIVEPSENGETTALAAGNAISSDPMWCDAAGDDHLDFEALGKRWLLVNQFYWESTQAIKTYLTPPMPVSPYLKGTSIKQNPPAGDVLHPFALATATFQQWRADMEFLVIIPKSVSHRGALQVSWSPVLLKEEGGSDLGTNIMYNALIDLSQHNGSIVKVGYCQREPFKMVGMVSLNPSIEQEDFINGFLSFRVINPLKSQAASSTLSVLVFARVRNPQVAALGNTITVVEAGGNSDHDMAVDVKYQSGLASQGWALGDDNELGYTPIDLVPSFGRVPASAAFYGEEVTSARALLLKPSPLGALASTVVRFGLPEAGVVKSGTTEPYPMTYQRLIAGMFAGVAASELFAVVGYNNDRPFAVGVEPSPTGTFSARAGPLAPVTYMLSGGAEFRVPYYSCVKFCNLRPHAADPARRWVRIGTNTNDTSFWHSFGADLRVAPFCQSLPLNLFKSTDVVPYFPKF